MKQNDKQFFAIIGEELLVIFCAQLKVLSL